MLGYQMYLKLSSDRLYNIHCVIRSESDIHFFKDYPVIVHVLNDFLDDEKLKSLFIKVSPHVVINCCGVINFRDLGTSLMAVDNIKSTILINSFFPHLLNNYSKKFDSRLILFSTDCVFSGIGNNYFDENSLTSPADLYGMSKLLGEVLDSRNVLTLRTSIIGHEIKNKNSFLEWFLHVNTSCKGFQNAIFSGLTTNEVTNVVSNIVLNNKLLSGIFHLAGHQISKYDLLINIAKIYNKNVVIIPEEHPIINRSLDGSKFCKLTGYKAPSWNDQIILMYKDHSNRNQTNV